MLVGFTLSLSFSLALFASLLLSVDSLLSLSISLGAKNGLLIYAKDIYAQIYKYLSMALRSAQIGIDSGADASFACREVIPGLNPIP